MPETGWERPPVDRESIKRSVRKHRKVFNRLESHLGCVVCQRPLTDGVCPKCDPKLIDGKDCSSGDTSMSGGVL